MTERASLLCGTRCASDRDASMFFGRWALLTVLLFTACKSSSGAGDAGATDARMEVGLDAPAGDVAAEFDVSTGPDTDEPDVAGADAAEPDAAEPDGVAEPQSDIAGPDSAEPDATEPDAIAEREPDAARPDVVAEPDRDVSMSLRPLPVRNY